jgi:hypothetical protein
MRDLGKLLMLAGSLVLIACLFSKLHVILVTLGLTLVLGGGIFAALG